MKRIEDILANYLSRADFLLKGLLQLFKAFLALAFLMFVFRVVFFIYFGEISQFFEFSSDILRAFWIGFQYDTVVITYFLFPLYINLIFISLIKNIFLYNCFQYIFKFFYVVFSLMIALVLITDLGFYSFFQDHINILIFGLFEDDTIALFKTLHKNYPLGWALLGFFFYFLLQIKVSTSLFQALHKKSLPLIQPGFFKYVLISLTACLLLVGGMRGGYGKFVISPKYSDFSDKEFINQLAYNGVVALEQAITLRMSRNNDEFSMTQAMGYGDNIHQAFTDYLGVDASPTPKDQLLNLIRRRTAVLVGGKEYKYNVIVLLMESFGSHWLKYNSEKFNFLGDLKKHFDEDYYFSNFISSENGTIGSLMTLATNVPPRPGKRFLSESKFMRTPLDSAAHIPYLNKGYETSFLYGGKLAWRDIGRYFKLQKYHNTYGENKIKNALLLTGRQGTEWGLYDHHLFDFMFNKLTHSSVPQFMLALSTSNHPPFEVPPEYEPLPLEISRELEGKILREQDLFKDRFKAFQYANQSLANFIQKIKDDPDLSARTIVVVTGDHNFWGFINYEKEEAYSKFKVPLYFYIPKQLRPSQYDSAKLASHEDIMSTIYNLSLSDSEYLSFGEDLFSAEKSFAINSVIYASDEGLSYKGKKYNWGREIPLVGAPIPANPTHSLLKELERRFRSTMTIADYYLEESLQKSE